ncbi:MAG TPA: metal-dependent hydrolase [Pelomicrobium sp.]|nr:metal-dependent hydrolase [Pelomicrobium sp.]
MDLLTQGILGATLAQAGAPSRDARVAAGVGFGAGLLADADALIQSGQDPLLVLEYHRHFTHALAFIPVGALVAAALLWPFLRRRLSFPRLYLYAFLGYALAGVLDACTSYGTHLLWPFSDERIAWSIIAIVDPVFTLLLLVPLGIGWWRRRPAVARAGLVLAALYLALGVVQHQRALEAARELAASRGHRPERLIVKPTLANLILWRSVYVDGTTAHADGVRVGLPGSVTVYPGEKAVLVDASRPLPAAPAGSRALADVQRFVRFADGYAAVHPTRPLVIGDVRYGMLPTSVTPLWGIELDAANPEAHARFVTERTLTPATRQRFVDMLLGRDPKD